jgi:hypothetical protein
MIGWKKVIFISRENEQQQLAKKFSFEIAENNVLFGCLLLVALHFHGWLSTPVHLIRMMEGDSANVIE